jgi:hypothetical protein
MTLRGVTLREVDLIVEGISKELFSPSDITVVHIDQLVGVKQVGKPV